MEDKLPRETTFQVGKLLGSWEWDQVCSRCLEGDGRREQELQEEKMVQGQELYSKPELHCPTFFFLIIIFLIYLFYVWLCWVFSAVGALL